MVAIPERVDKLEPVADILSQIVFDMSDKPITPLRNKNLSPRNEGEVSKEADQEIKRLRAELDRYREALENIRDQAFEQANSPRLIDQLWHFVRWSKATARGALEQIGETQKK